MKLIIWDFDGPIFESRRPRDIAFEKVAEHFRSIGAPQLHVESTPLYDPRRLIQLAYSNAKLDGAQMTALEDKLRELLKEEEAKVKIGDEIEQTLRRLPELKCRQAILSLRSAQGLNALLERLQIRKHFDLVYGGDTDPVPKPEPEVIDDILRKTGVSKSETILVGDSDIDLRAAAAAGIPYVHAGWSGEPITFAAGAGVCIAGSPRDIELLAMGSSPFPSTDDKRLELRDRASDGSFSFFAGAGVSIPSGIGGWKDTYLPILTRHLPQSAISQMSLPEAVQLICTDAQDSAKLFDDFKRLFDRARGEPNAYHLAMVRSRADTIWTTNYDMFFERAKIYTAATELSIIRNDGELKDSFGRGQKMIKVNGDFDSAKFDKTSMDWNLILSDEQFDISETQRQEIWRYFEDEFRTSCIVFVGVSFTDPTLKRVLSIISRRVMRPRSSHFVLALRPDKLQDRVIVHRQIELLRRRGLYTILFDSFEDIASFVCELCVRSRRPMIGFSGRTHDINKAGEPLVPGVEDTFLDKGQLTIRQITDLCANLGAELAKGGFRVGSGHGVGVGLPAVEEAHKSRRHAARFIVRMRGDTPISRSAPVITHGTDREAPRELLIGASTVLVAMGGLGGDSVGGEGTVQEARQAIDRGRPVLLIPQAGGSVHDHYDALMKLIERVKDDDLRKAVIGANQKIASLSAAELRPYLDREFCQMVMGLVQKLATSAQSRVFEESCARADSIW